MESTSNLIDEINSNEEYKSSILRLNNRILEIKLDYLSALRQHYDDYWLEFDSKCCDLRIDCLVSKAKFMTYQTSSKKLEEISRSLMDEEKSLDNDIARAEKRLMEYKKSDPDLLAEYQRLKDDLECQELLIEISEDNQKW